MLITLKAGDSVHIKGASYLNTYSNTKLLMKKLWFIIVFFFGALQGFSQSPAAIRKVLISLQPEEEIMYGESYLSLIIATNQVSLTTKLGNKFYVYTNGVRKGPFDDLEEQVVPPASNNENIGNKCSVYQPQENHQEILSYLSATPDGTYFVTLNNKKYGPYGSISHLHVWPDKTGFFAITVDQNMNNHLVTSEGLKVALKGDVEKIHVSPSGKKFLFAVNEREAVDMSILNKDFSKMTQEEIMKWAKEQEQKANNAPTPTSYVLLNGTTKFGPFAQNAFYSDNPAFTKNGNWIMSVNNTLYINGVKVKEFSDLDVNTCQTYLTPDGKKYAIASYDKIYFSDGKTYPSPMETTAIEKDGKVTLKWLSLENEKDLVLYSRDL
jgi:hypothetical protein